MKRQQIDNEDRKELHIPSIPLRVFKSNFVRSGLREQNERMQKVCKATGNDVDSFAN